MYTRTLGGEGDDPFHHRPYLTSEIRRGNRLLTNTPPVGRAEIDHRGRP